jgi:hypothetical protein
MLHNEPPMASPPSEVAGAKVLYYAILDERCRPTGSCKHRHFHVKKPLGPAAGLVVCEYPGEQGVFLFSCDRHWHCFADTWHPTLEEAMGQGEFEYEGVSRVWVEVPDGRSLP